MKTIFVCMCATYIPTAIGFILADFDGRAFLPLLFASGTASTIGFIYGMVRSQEIYEEFRGEQQ